MKAADDVIRRYVSFVFLIRPVDPNGFDSGS